VKRVCIDYRLEIIKEPKNVSVAFFAKRKTKEEGEKHEKMSAGLFFHSSISRVFHACLLLSFGWGGGINLHAVQWLLKQATHLPKYDAVRNPSCYP
jgi:hypothetical protein